VFENTINLFVQPYHQNFLQKLQKIK